MARFKLTKKQIHQGFYEGVLEAKSAISGAPALEMLYLGDVVGEVSVEPLGDNNTSWTVRVAIPSEFLTDGVQTFLIVRVGDTQILDRFSVVTGEPLQEDLRAEIELLRAELDMLKRAFRRHASQTMR